MKEETTRKILNDLFDLGVIKGHYESGILHKSKVVVFDNKSKFKAIEQALIKIQKKILSAQKQQPLTMSITFKERSKELPEVYESNLIVVLSNGHLTEAFFFNDKFFFYSDGVPYESKDNPVVLWAEKPDGNNILEELK